MYRKILTLVWVLFSLEVGETCLFADTPGSWPGMGPRTVRLAQHLVSTSRVILVAEPGQPERTVWVRNTRRYRKENGWYGLMVNGQPLPERYTFLEYGGRMENLQLLFTLGQQFAEEPPQFLWDYSQKDRVPRNSPGSSLE